MQQTSCLRWDLTVASDHILVPKAARRIIRSISSWSGVASPPTSRLNRSLLIHSCLFVAANDLSRLYLTSLQQRLILKIRLYDCVAFYLIYISALARGAAHRPLAELCLTSRLTAQCKKKKNKQKNDDAASKDTPIVWWR